MRPLLLSLLHLLPFTTSFAPSISYSSQYQSTKVVASSTQLHATESTDTTGGGVVITGGANGVGFAYAAEFLDRGYNVVICDVQDCSAAAAALQPKATSSGGSIHHTKCDVSSSTDVERLGKFAQEKLGTIQYWINNAGINGGRRELRDVPVSQVEAVVKVNLLGILLCTKVAMGIMEQQAGVTGHIFNTVGSGVKGGGTPGYATYGATKRGLPQFTQSLGTCYVYMNLLESSV